MSGKAKFRLFLLFVLAGVFGYVGFLIFRERNPIPPLEQAERYYKEGRRFDEQSEYPVAVDRYDQAIVLFEGADKRLEGTGHGLDKDKALDAKGRILYGKALALRDKHYAAALAKHHEQKKLTGDGSKFPPLPETMDTVTGKYYRNIIYIPDSAKADREKAVAELRGAAFFFLTKNEEAQVEALRLTLMLLPLQWEHIEKYANNILALKPDDCRAKYMLAKYHFEQPQTRTNESTPYAKRSLDNIRTAKRYIDEVLDEIRKDRVQPPYPMWRTEHLRVQIHRWLMKHWQGKDKKAYDTELENLSNMLLDSDVAPGPGNAVLGMLARIGRGDDIDNRLSVWDVDGILDLHVIAAEVAMEQYRRHQVNFYPVTKVFTRTLEFCEKKLKEPNSRFSRGQLIATLLATMSKSQSVLAIQEQKKWNEGIDFLRPMLDQEFESKRCEPLQAAQFAELLMREAQLRRKDKRRAEELRAEARRWLDRGLKFGEEKGFKDTQLLPFNLLAANIVFLNSNKREDVQKFLAALQRTDHPQARATALIIDGAYDEREGRLEKAKDKMEEANRILGGDEEVRANVTLANIYMAMGRPHAALVSLSKLQNIYDRYEDLSTVEKEWLVQFIRSPQDYYALVVIANLDNARRKVALHFAKNPNARGFPPDLVKDEELRVKTLIETGPLPDVTPAGFTARVALIEYLISTGQRKAAEAQWQKLSANPNYLDRVELLMSRVHMTVFDANTERDEKARDAKLKALPDTVDKLIEEYVKKNNNPVGKLYQALWYAQTQRYDEARQTLTKLKVDEGTTPEIKRIIATILISMDTGISPFSVLRHMDRDPRAINASVFLEYLKSQGKRPDGKQIRVSDEFTERDDTALSRILQAEKDVEKKDFGGAARKYANLLDFTRVKPLAQQGLTRSMLMFANQKPEEALELNKQLVLDHNREPSVFLTYAYCCLCCDKIGQATDPWEELTDKTMGAALDVWDQHLRAWQPNASRVAIALTRAEFWFLANRLDQAWAEASRARQIDKQEAAASKTPREANPAVLAACISIIVGDPAQDPKTKELEELLTELKKSAPNTQQTLQLIARAEEFAAGVGASKRERVIEAYEQLLAKFPKDQTAYIRLIDSLDKNGEHGKATNWIAKWEKEIPNDAEWAAAKVRIMSRIGNPAGALAFANEFVGAALVRAAEAYDSIAAKKVDLKVSRDKFLEDVKWAIWRDVSRGFYRGGAYAQAESQLVMFPPEQQTTDALELLGEVYLRQNQWTKAEEVYRRLVNQNRLNMVAVNNLAYLLAENLNKPSQARDIIREAIKTPKATTIRPADRFPPEFLVTVGVVYRKLDDRMLGREFLDFYQSAARRYPRNARVQLWAGYAHDLAGEYEQAERLYDKAKEIAVKTKLNDVRNEAVFLRDRMLENRRALLHGIPDAAKDREWLIARRRP